MRILSSFPISMFVNPFSDSEKPDSHYSQYIFLFAQLCSQCNYKIQTTLPPPPLPPLSTLPLLPLHLETNILGKEGRQGKERKVGVEVICMFCPQFFLS